MRLSVVAISRRVWPQEVIKALVPVRDTEHVALGRVAVPSHRRRRRNCPAPGT